MAIPLPNSQGNSGDNFLPTTPASNMIGPPRVDFDKNRFDTLVAQKGVDVLVEKALQCPCKTKKINAITTCKNCGGTGWIFVNPRRSRLVLQSMNFENKEEVWSRLVHGVVRVTAPAEEKLAYYDRITRLNANSIFSEIIEFEEYDGRIFGWLSYQPKSIEYIGLFIDSRDPLQQIQVSDVTIVNNRIELSPSIELLPFDDNMPLTATLRYVHAPTFNIIEHQREEIDNFRWAGNKGEVLQYLPVLALARRTHDIDDLVRLRQGKLNDNSYDDSSCLPENIYKPACNI